MGLFLPFMRQLIRMNKYSLLDQFYGCTGCAVIGCWK